MLIWYRATIHSSPCTLSTSSRLTANVTPPSQVPISLCLRPILLILLIFIYPILLTPPDEPETPSGCLFLGLLDPVGAAKWTAWNQLGDMPKNEAMATYIKLVAEHAPAQGQPQASQAQPTKGEVRHCMQHRFLVASVICGAQMHKNVSEASIRAKYDVRITQTNSTRASPALSPSTSRARESPPSSSTRSRCLPPSL